QCRWYSRVATASGPGPGHRVAARADRRYTPPPRLAAHRRAWRAGPFATCRGARFRAAYLFAATMGRGGWSGGWIWRPQRWTRSNHPWLSSSGTGPSALLITVRVLAYP